MKYNKIKLAVQLNKNINQYELFNGYYISTFLTRKKNYTKIEILKSYSQKQL